MLDGAEHLHDIEAYQQAGGYAQLKAARSIEPGTLIDDIKASGIRGRGGAGFPTGLKLSFIPKVDKPKYVVCNADESEPCTFKDREIIERLPHLLIEGCMIAAHAIGAQYAFIYIRGEYLEPFEILRDAAEQARAAGLIGVDGTPSLVIHRGAGAYICGEETALLSSLNGYRGQPTVKPPFPAVSGLYELPTLVNNVETLASLPRILEIGAATFAAAGVQGPGPASGTGTRVMSLSGHVNKPGNYELTIGTPLRELIMEHGGGVPGGRAIKAVIPGGSSTPVLTAIVAEDILMDYKSMADAGTMFGSGSVIVIDDRTCMAQLALRVAEFYKHESCGKCTPCREGTKWVVDLLARIVGGTGKPGDVDLLYEVNGRIMGKCLCPLGEAMAMPVRSYIEKFRSDFDRYLEPGFVPPDDSPMKIVAKLAVEHYDHAKPGVNWMGKLTRADLGQTGVPAALAGSTTDSGTLS
ncbi:MAG: NADH-quinone oxidoreductase subunit NuoF [Thermoleophilia bacterium]|nr:NADH-quinone oxidoreductase subunit NuoF [Thermoleophilia bacterium]